MTPKKPIHPTPYHEDNLGAGEEIPINAGSNENESEMDEENHEGEEMNQADMPSAAELYEENDDLAVPDAGGADNAVIEALRKELDETKDKMLRVAAEAQNIKRRSQQDAQDAKRYSISSFARELLSVADNMRRAMDSVPDELKAEDERIQNLMGGLEATERELLKAFQSNGVQKLEPMGEVFNPNYHEVMFEAPADGNQAPGTIIEIIEPGYILHDRLLRPARVGVVKDEGQGGAPEAGQVDTEA